MSTRLVLSSGQDDTEQPHFRTSTCPIASKLDNLERAAKDVMPRSASKDLMIAARTYCRAELPSGADLQVAATALAMGVIVAIGIVGDFEPTGVQIEDPF